MHAAMSNVFSLPNAPNHNIFGKNGSASDLQSFTLIELLTVIAIISILAALLFPSISTAKQRAHCIQCMSNLKQIGLAMAMYGDDHGVYPWGWYSNPPNDMSWSVYLNPPLSKLQGTDAYDKNSRSPVLTCPAASIKSTNQIMCSYSVHNRVFGNSADPGVTAPTYPRHYPFEQRTFEIVLAADAGLYPDGEAAACFYGHSGMDQDYNPTTAEDPADPGGDADGGWPGIGAIRWRHQGNANLLFFDCHVESMAKNALKDRNLKITGP
jgi:prepilin-type processing-associated H-X9-DG protein/prepilin-type N-terminal cleavage/methylation domain-containing protein